MQYRLREFLHELPGGGALRLSGLPACRRPGIRSPGKRSATGEWTFTQFCNTDDTSSWV